MNKTALRVSVNIKNTETPMEIVKGLVGKKEFEIVRVIETPTRRHIEFIYV